MASPAPVNTQQWRTNYNIVVESSHWKIWRAMVFKQTMFDALVTDKKKKILDLGCGTGYRLNYLASRGFKNLYGVEPDLGLIGRTTFYNTTEIRNGTAENISFEDSSFDVVIVDGVLHHLKGLEPYKTACDEIYRVLKPGGLVIIMEPGSRFLQSIIDVTIRFLGIFSTTYRALSECIEEEIAEYDLFFTNLESIKDYLGTQKGFKVIVNKHFIHFWLFTARKSY